MIARRRIIIVISIIVATLLILGGYLTYLHNVKNAYREHTLVVLCGAGLMKPMNELVKMFENKYHVKIEVDYGGSGELFAKLEMGIGDVFVPGSYYYIKIAQKKGLVIPNTIVNITLHIPVIAVPAGNPAHIRSLKDLLRPGVRIAIGNPNACAIGRVTIKIFKKNGLYSLFLEKLKHGEIVEAPTVNQLLLYVVTGQVDAAIIWEDLATWPQSRGKIEIIHIPAKENIIKTIAAAVTIYAEKNGNLKIAEEFVRFISSSEGLKIWEKWGFRPCR
ncbi:MAG: molybdate ABC transporter substrate-binding protein [Crenarchaeota archaeon]|nr:molybdate ABC transporter substrate-binding protein [Thermoproteota archaeon]